MKASEAFEISKHNSMANDHREFMAVLDEIKKRACEGLYYLMVEKMPPYSVMELKNRGYTVHENKTHNIDGDIYDLIAWESAGC